MPRHDLSPGRLCRSERCSRTDCRSRTRVTRPLRRLSCQHQALCEQTGLRVAFVGNSATQRGIEKAQFCAELASPAHPRVDADLFLADGSMINTWHYLVKDLFWRPHLHPDWIVITFFDSCLADESHLEIGHLATCFTKHDDWPDWAISICPPSAIALNSCSLLPGRPMPYAIASREAGHERRRASLPGICGRTERQPARSGKPIIQHEGRDASRIARSWIRPKKTKQRFASSHFQPIARTVRSRTRSIRMP